MGLLFLFEERFVGEDLSGGEGLSLSSFTESGHAFLSLQAGGLGRRRGTAAIGVGQYSYSVWKDADHILIRPRNKFQDRRTPNSFVKNWSSSSSSGFPCRSWCASVVVLLFRNRGSRTRPLLVRRVKNFPSREQFSCSSQEGFSSKIL